MHNFARHFFSSSKSFLHKDLVKTLKATVKPDLSGAKLGFGQISTDYMATMRHDGNRGWLAPEIQPFQPLQIHPFNSSLHYGLCCFEGLKAYRGVDGRVRLFRPMENMQRMLTSCQRLAFPDFSPEELFKVMKELIQIERNWIPSAEQGSLYIRPFAFSMTDVLGVHRAPDTMLMVTVCPVGSYFAGEINLSVCEDFWRGTPHSAAAYKIGANYAPTVLIGDQLAAKGFSQAIWVYDDCLLESGATNLFFVVEETPGKPELITHPLDGSILPGITRDSILKIAPDVIKGIKVSERPFRIPEFIKLHEQGKLKEVFVSGTASVIGEVHSIEIRGKTYKMDYPAQDKMRCMALKKRLVDIQFGVIPHPFAYALN